MKQPEIGELDQIDRAILRLLVEDGRMPVTEIASKVGLSKTPCQVRVNRMRDSGVIRGFRAVVDLARLGQDHVCYAEVRLSDTSERALSDFNQAVIRIPQVEQCHMIAGAFDYLLKVRTADIKEYRRVLGETVGALPHVASTSTHVSMEAVVD